MGQSTADKAAAVRQKAGAGTPAAQQAIAAAQRVVAAAVDAQQGHKYILHHGLKLDSVRWAVGKIEAAQQLAQQAAVEVAQLEAGA